MKIPHLGALAVFLYESRLLLQSMRACIDFIYQPLSTSMWLYESSSKVDYASFSCGHGSWFLFFFLQSSVISPFSNGCADCDNVAMSPRCTYVVIQRCSHYFNSLMVQPIFHLMTHHVEIFCGDTGCFPSKLQPTWRCVGLCGRHMLRGSPLFLWENLGIVPSIS